MNILFVSHDANRAGAQLLLLRFLQMLHASKQHQFSVLFKGKSGDLVAEFQEIADDIYFWDDEYKKLSNKRFWKKGSSFASQSFDLVVSNTITNGQILPKLKAIFGCNILTYVHEMEIGIKMYTSEEDFQKVLDYSDGYIACGEAVKTNLIENHGINSQKIEVLPSLLPENALGFIENPNFKKELFQRFDIPNNALLVGGMGTIDLRKGVDIFVAIARELSHQNLFFLWVGGSEDIFEYKMFQIDIQRLKLRNIKFQTMVSNPLDYMRAFDIFLLSSREEAYPLVVMEAALMAKPIVCFRKAGGGDEVVADDAGVAVPYLNNTAMKNAIEILAQNPDQRIKFGEIAREKVLKKHQKDVALQKFLSILSWGV
jgi:glycosyltransferase involved in cell wall biosynthesis